MRELISWGNIFLRKVAKHLNKYLIDTPRFWSIKDDWWTLTVFFLNISTVDLQCCVSFRYTIRLVQTNFQFWTMNFKSLLVDLHTSLLIKIGTITIKTFLPTRNKYVFSCNIKVCALGFYELLESIFCLPPVVDVFSL